MIPTCDVQLSLTCLCSLDLGLGQGQKKVMQPGLAGREAASPGPMWGKAPRKSRLRESNNKTGVCSGAQKEWKREKMEHESGEMVQIPSSMCLWELHLYPANSTMFSPVALFPASPPSVHSPPHGPERVSSRPLPIERLWCESPHPSWDPQNLPELAPGALQPHPLTMPPSTQSLVTQDCFKVS